MESKDDLLSVVGLKAKDIDRTIANSQDLIDEIVSSGRLYRKSMSFILFKGFKNYLDNPNLNRTDKLSLVFEAKSRRADWKHLRNTLFLKVPGLKLTRVAQTFLIIYLIALTYLFIKLSKLASEYLDLIVALKLSGFAFFPVVILLILPLGALIMHGSNRLPAKTIDDLIDKILEINSVDLLSNDKQLLVKILDDQLNEQAAHNNN